MGEGANDVRPPERPGSHAGFLTHYKPEQGKATRTGTFVGLGLLVLWGAYFVWDRLQVYEGDEVWQLLVTVGIPAAVAVVFGALAWRVSYVTRKSSDFMIATEGEMKKVSWSSKREVIGSTKVVIVFTILMAIVLFLVDMGFQTLFRAMGVLKA